MSKKNSDPDPDPADTVTDPAPSVSKSRAWQLRQIAAGRCPRCGGKRKKDDLPSACQACRVKRNQIQKEKYHERRKSKDL